MRVAVEAYGYVGKLLEGVLDSVELPDEGATVADVERALIDAVPELADAASGLAYAIDAEAVGRAHPVRTGERVIILSPVSGG